MDPNPNSASSGLFRCPRLVRPVLLLSILCALLGVWFHHDRAWQGDEWGSYLALNQSYRALLTHFGEWQTMNFYLAGLKLLHDGAGARNWLLVLPGILCNAWLVCLAASLALRLGGSARAALTAALLVAVNPYLVAYSVTIRSYIFLAAFSSAMLLGLLDWRQTGRWREGILCGFAGALALLAHLNAIYTLTAAGVLALSWTAGRAARRETGGTARLLRLAIPVLLLGALAAAAYLPQGDDIRRFRTLWSYTPPIPPTYLPTVFAMFFGKGWLLLPTLAALLYAVWRAGRGRRPALWVLLAVITTGAALSLAGVSHYPWAYARFLIAVLPWLILLVADGLWATEDRGCRATTLAVAILAACNVAALHAARTDQHRLPWHHVAACVRPNLTPATRCVLVGPQVHETALHLYGVPSQGTIAAALAGAPANKPLDLLIIDTTGALSPAGAGQQIGRIRVVPFQGTPGVIAGPILQSLIAGCGGRIAGDLANAYQQIVLLLEWEGRAADAPEYDARRAACQRLDKRVRYALPQSRDKG